MRFVVTQSRVDVFDATAVMACVKFCTRVAMFCHNFNDCVKNGKGVPQSVLDLCKRMRTFEPQRSTILMQLVGFSGGLPTPPPDAHTSFLEVFPFERSLCDFTDAELKATTHYLLCLLVEAQEKLVRGIRKANVAAAAESTREHIDPKCLVEPKECAVMSNQDLMDELKGRKVGTFRALLLVFTLFTRMRRFAAVFDPDCLRYPSAALAAMADLCVRRHVRAWPVYNPSA